MSEAGGSAQSEYERRRARDAETKLRKLPVALVLVPLSGVVVYFLVRDLAPWVLQNVISGLIQEVAGGEVRSEPVMTAEQAHPFALLFAVLASLSMAKVAWGARPTTVAWAKGAAGERRTASVLESLEREGFRVLHDRRIPGRRSNIDHVLVGPTGVFTVESKQYKGKLDIRGRSLRHNGRRKDVLIEQAWRQAQAVDAVLGGAGVQTQPVLCIHGAEITRPWFAASMVQGVVVCSGRRLAKRLRGRRRVLEHLAVENLARQLDEALPRMVIPRRPRVTPPDAVAVEAPSSASTTHDAVAVSPPTTTSPGTCGCGGRLVLRHRRSDGAPFWGCSNFPRCRQTKPIAS